MKIFVAVHENHPHYEKLVGLVKTACMREGITYIKAGPDYCDMVVAIAPYSMASGKKISACVLDYQVLDETNEELPLEELRNCLQMSKIVYSKENSLFYPILIGCAAILFIGAMCDNDI
jgi:hypothetical protein